MRPEPGRCGRQRTGDTQQTSAAQHPSGHDHTNTQTARITGQPDDRPRLAPTNTTGSTAGRRRRQIAVKINVQSTTRPKTRPTNANQQTRSTQFALPIQSKSTNTDSRDRSIASMTIALANRKHKRQRAQKTRFQARIGSRQVAAKINPGKINGFFSSIVQKPLTLNDVNRTFSPPHSKVVVRNGLVFSFPTWK